MSDLIKFNHISITKGQFFTWLTSELENNGWVREESNYTGEGWIYRSKGSDGKQDIIVNFRDGYDSYMTFTSGNTPYFDMRMLISYTPNETPGKNGTHVPVLNNSAFTRILFDVGVNAIYPDARYDIYYNCNKDRMVMMIKGRNSTLPIMFGRPSKKYAKEYADTGNLIIANNNNRHGHITTWGVADRPSTSPQIDAVSMIVNTGRGFYQGRALLSEIGMGSVNEGFKGYLEGVYAINSNGLANGKLVEDDKIIDELGNEFSIFYPGHDGGTYPNRYPNMLLAVCTRLAGDI